MKLQKKWYIWVPLFMFLFLFLFSICLTSYLKIFPKSYVIGDVKVRFHKVVFYPSFFNKEEVIKKQNPIFNRRNRTFISTSFIYLLNIQKYDNKNLDLEASHSRLFPKVDSLKIDDDWFYLRRAPSGVFVVNYNYYIEFFFIYSIVGLFRKVSIKKIKKFLSGIELEVIREE